MIDDQHVTMGQGKLGFDPPNIEITGNSTITNVVATTDTSTASITLTNADQFTSQTNVTSTVSAVPPPTGWSPRLVIARNDCDNNFSGHISEFCNTLIYTTLQAW